MKIEEVNDNETLEADTVGHDLSNSAEDSCSLSENKSEAKPKYVKKEKGETFLGVEWAPLVLPWERRMQTLAVSVWLGSFMMMGPASFIFLMYLLFYTKYYYLTILYFFWFLYDKDRCNRGGRRTDWMRNLKLWKHYRDYFPLRLVKTIDLDPKKNYLFASHPHGILCSGAWGNFATEATNFSQVFPNITPHLLALEGHFSFPFYREYAMAFGACAASRSSLNYLMSRPDGGNVAVLVPGGATESLDTRPGKFTKLHLRNRKGFIKVALQNGASIVPVYSFGETSIYDQIPNPEGSMIRNIQNKLQKVAGLAPVLVKGRGFFQYSFGILPQRRPITTVVGHPISVEKNVTPTQEQIDALHQKYLDSVVKLFDTYKVIYADAGDVLEII